MLSSTLSLDALRRQAKSMRSGLAQSGHIISHSQSLELLAKQHGFRDWNTLHASFGNHITQPVYAPGQSVSGRYLGKPFEGKIITARRIGETHTELAIRFDTAVDVSRFASMEVKRKQIKATINRDGRTLAKTSDGVAHLILHS